MVDNGSGLANPGDRIETSIIIIYLTQILLRLVQGSDDYILETLDVGFSNRNSPFLVALYFPQVLQALLVFRERNALRAVGIRMRWWI